MESSCPGGNLMVNVLLEAGDVAFRGVCGAAVGVVKTLGEATCLAEGFEKPCRKGMGLGIAFFGALGLGAWDRGCV